MDFAGGLLRLASWVAPAERGEWLAAMKAEYAALDTGRFNWAAGTFAVASGWRLRKDGVYVLLLCAAAWFLGAPLQQLALFYVQHIPRVLWDIGLYPAFYHYAAIGFLIGLYRPRLIVLTALALMLWGNLTGILSFYKWYESDAIADGRAYEDFWQFVRTMKIHDAKPVAGILAQFGACLVGGLLGRWIASLFRKAKIASGA